jgi:2-amino-4-hydroxy-6-hydroxymethyldihydropteridine diphosphokinase
MTRVYLSLGSNIDAPRHLRNALVALRANFGEVHISPVYEALAVGFDGDNFLNLVVAIETNLGVAQLSTLLRGIEAANGRIRGTAKFSSRSLDIDILTYGDAVGVIDGIELPRDEIERYGFVIKPLADLAGDERYPVTGLTYRELCAQMQVDDKSLWRVDVDLLGELD